MGIIKAFFPVEEITNNILDTVEHATDTMISYGRSALGLKQGFVAMIEAVKEEIEEIVAETDVADRIKVIEAKFEVADKIWAQVYDISLSGSDDDEDEAEEDENLAVN